MKLNRGYNRDANEGDDRLTVQEVAIAGVMDGDGDIYPSPNMTLVAKKQVKTAQTTADPVNIIADLATWLGVAQSEVSSFKLVVHTAYSSEGDAATNDAVTYFLYAGATPTQAITEASYGQPDANRSTTPSQIGIVFFPATTDTILKFDHANWGAAETHNSYVTVLAYRMPSSIVS